MNATPIQSETSRTARFVERCREAGLALLTVDARGSLLDACVASDRILDRALVGFRLLHALAAHHVQLWEQSQTLEPAPAFPGCWLIPVPILRRRRREGYHLIVMASREIGQAEQFSALCASASLDHLAARSLLPETRLGRVDILRWSRLLNAMNDDLLRLDRQHEEIAGLSQQLSETYEELNLVYKMAAHLTVTQDPASFLSDACDELRQVAGLRWIALQIIDGDDRMKQLSGRLISSSDASIDLSSLRGVGQELIKRFGSGHTLIVDDSHTLDIPELSAAASKLMIVPIVREAGVLGLLIGADKITGGQLTTIDSKLATTTAQNMGIFLENAMLYEDMQDMFMGTLHALIASIDAKDAYTCGHSERVAWLSRELAAAAGLDPHLVERVYLSGLVHDVGKIGVPESVLCKAGRLTDEEFGLIKLHPEIGVRILKDIRQMQDLLPGVLHHHERYDGRGYPRKLAGESIPLFGRIIAMADSFDAMSSDRTYRRALSREQAVGEIRKCGGMQFDPNLVAAFERIQFEPYYQMVRQHQQRISPGADAGTQEAGR